MGTCTKCGRELADNDLIYWKCPDCGKVFNASLAKLKNLWNQKQARSGQALLKCPGCGVLLDNGNEMLAYKCPGCGAVGRENLEGIVCERESDLKVDFFHKEKIFCKNCGKELNEKLEFCPNCGISRMGGNDRFCSKCGSRIENDAKFCPNCGKKSPSNLNINVKILPIKKIAIVLGILFLLVSGIITGSKIIPKIFVTPEQLMTEGNYEKAYSKAKKDKKEQVLVENLIIDICNDIKDNMKDPSSFGLRDVWYESRGRKRMVLYTSGKNSVGGIVSSLEFYFFNEGEYQMFTSITDMEDEEYYSFDEVDDKVEKAWNNIARSCIREIRIDSNKIDSEIIDRINKLNEKDLMKNIKLLDDVKEIYPSENASDNDAGIEI